MRLGLSATPRRWYDEEGTQRLLSYFSGIVFEFGLEDAIGKYLTPYEYNPVLVALTDPELASYQELSARIALAAKKAETNANEHARVEKLLLERARIIWKAENKLPAAMTLLRRLKTESEERHEELRHLLVYCAPGEHATVLRSVAALGFRCHEFVHSVVLRDRRKILEAFARGEIQVLVAIRCLDEGVDVPSTRAAMFMASTTNPREFIQRRGRVLRRAPGKSFATIYDLVTVPPTADGWRRRGSAYCVTRCPVSRSLRRQQGTSTRLATSSATCWTDGMLHLLDLRPWDIYRDTMSSRDLDSTSVQSAVVYVSPGEEANGHSQ